LTDILELPEPPAKTTATTPPRLCKDCRHYKAPTTCMRRPMDIDLITGREFRIPLNAESERRDGSRNIHGELIDVCGKAAKYFEPRTD
jgi:hypothetical protein